MHWIVQEESGPKTGAGTMASPCSPTMVAQGPSSVVCFPANAPENVSETAETMAGEGDK